MAVKFDLDHFISLEAQGVSFQDFLQLQRTGEQSSV